MADTTKKPNTVKSIGKKVADNGNADDYVYIPIGADADNVDRPDGSTVEDSLVNIESKKVEIIPVETLPTNDIKEYPFVYALVRPNETKGILYEYRNNEWIPYGNGSNGIWLGTKEECAKEFNNIENGTIVIIINKNEDTGETHTHDYVCFVTKEPTYSQSGIKTYICYLCGDSYTEEVPALVDSIKPAGVIRIGNNEYSSWKDSISFDTYYKDNQSVSIEATDNETGVKEIAYYLATSAISLSDIGSVNWTVYNDTFEIAPNNNYIVYVRIKDNSDNVTYICSDGIVMDNIPPVFEGLQDGGTYPTGTVLTVEEGAILTVNGQTVDLVNNTYTFSEVMDNCILSITDKAGNENSIEVIIIHTCHFIDGICDSCGASEYEDIELTKDNLYMTGLVSNPEDFESLTGNVVIPEKFEYNGQKYKTTSIDFSTNYVHYGYTNVTNLVLPDSLLSIKGLRLFYNIESFNIPKNVTVIIDNASKYNDNTKLLIEMSNLKTITYSAKLFIPKTDKDLIFRGIFSNCKIIFEENIEHIPCLFDGFNKSGSSSTNVSEIEILNPEATISDFVFCSMKSLTNVILPRNLKEIPKWAFSNCTSLTNIVLPESLTVISENAFSFCKNLQELTVPDSVTSIGYSAFYQVPHVTYHGSANGSPWDALAIN